MSQRRLVVSGFEPFDGHVRNPSGEAALHLDGSVVEGLLIDSVLLPVSWVWSFRRLADVVAAVKPHALLMLGVSNRDEVSFERFAYNEANGQLDMDGIVGPASPLIEGGPPVLEGTLPLHALDSSPIASRVSTDPGRYLCNDVYYRAMSAFSGVPLRGFVHLPPLRSVVSPRGFDEDGLRAAVTTLVGSLAAHFATITPQA